MHIILTGKIMRQVPQGVNNRACKREKINVYIKNSSLEPQTLWGRGEFVKTLGTSHQI